tara:strand:+ start:2602 stop:2763 length:162 start_codon:yes stop_codon:yes gene_type:complete
VRTFAADEQSLKLSTGGKAKVKADASAYHARYAADQSIAGILSQVTNTKAPDL